MKPGALWCVWWVSVVPPNHSHKIPSPPSNPPVQPLAADYQDPHWATAGWYYVCYWASNSKPTERSAKGFSWTRRPSTACTSANLGPEASTHTWHMLQPRHMPLSDWKMHKDHQECSLLPGYAHVKTAITYK